MRAGVVEGDPLYSIKLTKLQTRNCLPQEEGLRSREGQVVRGLLSSGLGGGERSDELPTTYWSAPWWLQYLTQCSRSRRFIASKSCTETSNRRICSLTSKGTQSLRTSASAGDSIAKESVGLGEGHLVLCPPNQGTSRRKAGTAQVTIISGE